MHLRHFLSLKDLSPCEFMQVVMRAIELKRGQPENNPASLMQGKTAVLIFEKSSTRTRVSFESGIAQLGGSSIFLGPAESHLNRGESIEDTSRVLSRMVSLIIMRTGPHERVERMAEHAAIPVINGLSDFNHPCQLLADIQTFMEHRGEITGRIISWIGDGNNVCHSWMNAAKLLNFQLNIACPVNYRPDHLMIAECEDNIAITEDPLEAARGSALVVTDTWASMGNEKEMAIREKIFRKYCVNESVMQVAAKDALFMHCLPAYRGAEVTSGVIDGPQSVVFDETENRLHAQKSLIEFLLQDSL